MKNNQTSHLVKPLVMGSLFLSSAVVVQAVNFDYTEGHGHFGLNYNLDPPDPRDRRDGTSNFPIRSTPMEDFSRTSQLWTRL